MASLTHLPTDCWGVSANPGAGPSNRLDAPCTTDSLPNDERLAKIVVEILAGPSQLLIGAVLDPVKEQHRRIIRTERGVTKLRDELARQGGPGRKNDRCGLQATPLLACCQ